MKYKIIITGAAGFIGFHFSLLLLSKNFDLIGIDNLEGFYDKKLKQKRLSILKQYKNFSFYKADISNIDKTINKNDISKISSVFNFAAQPGVRLSYKYSDNYLNSNVTGFSNLLHFVSKNKIKYFFYASSSSVYGDLQSNQNENVFGNIKSYYALTKVINEKITKEYSKLYTNTKFIGLRFFTVYGPYGRPDMAVYDMTNSIFLNKKIILFNKGKNSRDYTYIDDLTNLLFSLYKYRDNISKNFEIFNMGFGKSFTTIQMLEKLEKIIGISANIKFGNNSLDVIKTKSNFNKLKSFLKLNDKIITNIPLQSGLLNFVEWYKLYNKI